MWHRVVRQMILTFHQSSTVLESLKTENLDLPMQNSLIDKLVHGVTSDPARGELFVGGRGDYWLLKWY